MKKRSFCVYVYYVKDMPIYVGKGKKQRPWVHLRRSHNAGLAQFITWAKEEGIHVAPEIVFYTEEEFEAVAKGKDFITFADLREWEIIQQLREAGKRSA